MDELFRLGAFAVVDVPNGQVHCRQGPIADLAMKGSPGGDWATYNRSSGRWEIVNGLVVPKDGAFQSGRTNFWNNGTALDRGLLAEEAGGDIIKTNPPAQPDHIIDYAAAYGSNAFQVDNLSGSAFRGVGQNAGTSAAFDHVISLWVRKIDRSPVTSADCYIFCGDASGDWADANQKAGATTYEPFRNGWTRLWARVPLFGVSATRAQGLKVGPGRSLLVEMGMHERTTTGTPGPLDWVPTTSLTDVAKTIKALEVYLRGGTSHGPHLPAGAIAVAFRPDRPSTDHTFSQVVQYGSDLTHHAITLSDSSNAPAYWVNIGGVSTAFIAASDVVPYTAHKALGCCAMWGDRGGSSEYFFSVNGARQGLITSATTHPNLSSARMIIGAEATDADVLSSAADSRILYVGLWTEKPGRDKCDTISVVMQKYAEQFWPWQ